MKKLILALALTTPLAHAEFFTGNSIQKWSDESSSNNISWGMLYGYVSGVYDTGSGAVFCPPQNVQLRQIVDMVTSHVSANPATRHYSGDIIIGYVLKAAWPCNKKGAGV